MPLSKTTFKFARYMSNILGDGQSLNVQAMKLW